jgi:peroxiredoxin
MLKKSLIILMAALLVSPVLAKPLLTIGSPAPNIILPDVNGHKTSLDKYLGSQTVVLSFFASWSKSCQQEMAFLQELAKKYRYKNLKVIGISYDRKLEHLQAYLANEKITFTVLHDRKLKTLKDYRILIIPTLCVIDQEGNITSSYVDYDENVKKAVAKDIQKLLTPPKK